MESWAIQAIISIGQVVVTIGALMVILRWNGYGRVSNREFRKQTELCNKRFAEMAGFRREIKASLKNIQKRLKGIESRIDRIDKGVKTK